MIERERRGEVLVLRLAHGRANALDLELCEAIATAFEEASSDGDAIVLTGSGSIFSAGVDLVRLVREGEPYVREFLPALSRAVAAIVSCDRPVVAAINGHAIAGGCILAAACDLRLMADGGGRIGVPELHVGVPFPTLAIHVLRNALPLNRHREVLLTGATWPPAEALDRGLIDRVIAAGNLLDDAVAAAGGMGALEPRGFALTKGALLRSVRERLHEAETDDVLDRWTAPETLEAIRDYLDRTVRKK